MNEINKNLVKKDPLKTDLVNDKTTKTDERIDFFGICDMLECFIMDLSHILKDNGNEDYNEFFISIVNNLSKIMSVVAGYSNDFDTTKILELLERIEVLEKNNAFFDGFVIPGTTPIGAKIHIVRTITRRCELMYAKVYEKYGGSDVIFEYLNKLSTFFYDLALSYDIKVKINNKD